MKRRMGVAIFLAIWGASAAWGKWNKDEQKYLDDQFRATLEQVLALKTQVATLTTQLNELRQSQTQLQLAIIRQQRALQEISQALSAMRTGGEERYAGLQTAISRLEAQQQKGFSTLTGQAAQAPVLGVETPAPVKRAASAPPTPTQGYVVEVNGNEVTLDIGTEKGLTPGAHLPVYKANDPSTRVGVLEIVTSTAGSSQARSVTLNPGVQLEFSDIVRLE